MVLLIPERREAHGRPIWVFTIPERFPHHMVLLLLERRYGQWCIVRKSFPHYMVLLIPIPCGDFTLSGYAFPHYMVLLLHIRRGDYIVMFIKEFPHHLVLLLPSLTNVVILGIYLNIFMGVLRQVSNKPMSI